TASFDAEPLEAHAHEEFLYDSQCTCVEDYESTPVAERDKLRACAGLEDCCDKGAGRVCFNDPEDNGFGKCTTCRQPGQWNNLSGGDVVLPPDWGDYCNDDDDCCDDAICFSGAATGTPYGVCMPKQLACN